MNEHLAALVRRLRDNVLTHPGVTEPSLRQAVEAQADDIPPNLQPYIQKVAHHAYKVTDNDIEALKQAGYSEDAIFELTICAAVGAANDRLERGMDALKGAK